MQFDAAMHCGEGAWKFANTKASAEDASKQLYRSFDELSAESGVKKSKPEQCT